MKPLRDLLKGMKKEDPQVKHKVPVKYGLVNAQTICCIAQSERKERRKGGGRKLKTETTLQFLLSISCIPYSQKTISGRKEKTNQQGKFPNSQRSVPQSASLNIIVFVRFPACLGDPSPLTMRRLNLNFSYITIALFLKQLLTVNGWVQPPYFILPVQTLAGKQSFSSLSPARKNKLTGSISLAGRSYQTFFFVRNTFHSTSALSTVPSSNPSSKNSKLPKPKASHPTTKGMAKLDGKLSLLEQMTGRKISPSVTPVAKVEVGEDNEDESASFLNTPFNVGGVTEEETKFNEMKITNFERGGGGSDASDAAGELEKEQQKATKTQQKEEEEGNFSFDDEEEDGVRDFFSTTTTANNQNNPDFANPSINSKSEGSFTTLTLDQISEDYRFPLCYLADVVSTFGVPPPVDIHIPVGEMVNGEQSFALLEAVNSLQGIDLDEQYCDDNISNLCDRRDWTVPEVLSIAQEEGWSLPFGVRTCLRWEEVAILEKKLDKPKESEWVGRGEWREPGRWIETG